MIRLVRLWVRKERLLRFASGIRFNQRVETSIARCRHAFGGRKFEVLCSAETAVPVTLGARRPVIILPEHFCTELDEETLVSVIGHEVAHVSRYDYALNLVCEFVSLPISVHPLTYLIKREIERSRELACDESVTKLLLGPQTYARSLVRVANATMPGTRSLVLSILDGNILEQRIMKLTHARTRVRRGLARTITLAALSALGVVVILISNLSFDLRAYADSQSASALGVNIDRSALRKEGEGKHVAAPEVRPSRPEQSTKVTVSPEQSGTEQNAQERARAACAVAQQKSFDSIPGVIAMLGDDSQSELIRCWEGTHWSPALETFKHPSPGEQAALALASLGPPAFEPLANQLSSSNATVRRNAAWAIGELTGMIPGARASAVPPLITLLTDADPWVRMAAARALGELHDQRATTGMVAALSDSDWRVRELSAWALSEMKDRSAVNALCHVLLSDPQVEVRRQAAEALGEIRSAEALASLKQAVNDAEPRVRAKVGWAISEIEDSGG
jgi:beta-lactamase regulating signal transducer with metallopeptidase domain